MAQFYTVYVFTNVCKRTCLVIGVCCFLYSQGYDYSQNAMYTSGSAPYYQTSGQVLHVDYFNFSKENISLPVKSIEHKV
jgi:hypothetical protein